VSTAAGPRRDEHGKHYPNQQDFHGLSPSSFLSTTGRRSVAALAIALLFCAPALAAEIEPLIIITHTSDPTASRRSETTTDFIGIGATIRFGRFNTVEADLAVGRQAINCNARGKCGSSPGGFVTLKIHPFRKWSSR
jgi:hypothetical protein